MVVAYCTGFVRGPSCIDSTGVGSGFLHAAAVLLIDCALERLATQLEDFKAAAFLAPYANPVKPRPFASGALGVTAVFVAAVLRRALEQTNVWSGEMMLMDASCHRGGILSRAAVNRQGSTTIELPVISVISAVIAAHVSDGFASTKSPN